MRFFRIAWLFSGVALVLVSAAPAGADIAAFNAAMKTADYKAATAAAAETWPTLDKNRDDIAVIAREFSFAALVNNDLGAAQTYAQAAVDHDAKSGAPAEMLDLSREMLQLVRHKAAPTKLTREALFAAATARATHPGVDTITYMSVDAIVAFDTQRQDWDKARAADALAIHFMTEGGPAMLLDRRKYELFAATAAYMDEKGLAQYEALVALTDTLVADMAAADSDKAAQAFAPLYWTASAWANTFRNHLAGRGGYSSKINASVDAQKARRKAQRWPDRVIAALGREADEDSPCRLKMKLDPFPQYPPSALFKGFLSTIVLRVDIDADGRSNNPKLLASAPLQNFGEVVLKAVPGLTFSPGKAWDAQTCTVARTGHVIYFQFIMDR